MRPTVDQYFVRMSEVVASRSTCLHRRVGCVLTDKHDHILSTGYNGAPSGMKHCVDLGCLRETSKSGENLDLCRATHAEQNALLQCKDVHKIKTAYITTAPCVTCTRLLLNTSCERIVYTKPYNNVLAQELWDEAGRKMEHFKEGLTLEGAFRTYITARCMGNVEEVLENKLKEYRPDHAANDVAVVEDLTGTMEEAILMGLVEDFEEAIGAKLDPKQCSILYRVGRDMSNWR